MKQNGDIKQLLVVKPQAYIQAVLLMSVFKQRSSFRIL